MAGQKLSEPTREGLKPPSRPIDRVLAPVTVFLEHRLAGAGVLMLATVAAVAIANSPLGDTYHHLLHTHISLTIGESRLDYSLQHWVNDGLMGVFFFLVGLEIKREVLVGELSSVRKAMLPAVAAVGGMVVPALVYWALNGGTETAQGWGIPMATDIAFALGVLALLSDRVPAGLKVFLTALAIVDDIGAVLVIAIFYTADLSVGALSVGFMFLALAVICNLADVRDSLFYLVIGVCVWVAFLKSGVHATIAAILMAFTIPATTRIDGRGLLSRLQLIVAHLEKIGVPEDTRLNEPEQQHALDAMTEIISHAGAPLQRIERGLHEVVTFGVLPVFALANAGVTLNAGSAAELFSPLSLGVILGLFVGKQVGISLASWGVVKMGLADLPRGADFRQIHGVSVLAGIGFTMSLFIATLAFPALEHVEAGKMAIFAASLLSGVIGYVALRFATKRAIA